MIWIAEGDSFLAQADALVDRLATEEGRATSSRPSNATCLVATSHGSVIATLCVTLFEPFACQETYPAEVELLIGTGRAVSEVTRFASDKGGRRLILGLISSAYSMRVGRRVDDCLIEINPKHVSFYEKLGFKVYGSERHCARANAPAVLMRLVLDHASHGEAMGLQRI